MADPKEVVRNRVPRGAALPRQVSPTLSRTGGKSNPATSSDPQERYHANSGRSTISEVRKDSPLSRVSTSTTAEEGRRSEIHGHEPWNQNPQPPGAQVRPAASSRPEVSPTLPSHPPTQVQLTNAPTHTRPPSQSGSGGGVERLWGPKEEQHGTDEEIKTSHDIPSQVTSVHGHIPMQSRGSTK